MARSAEALKTRRELEKELESASKRVGQNLVWTAAEQAVLGLICDEIDRKSALSKAWSEATDSKVRVRVSDEMRLLEQSIARLLKQVNTDLPSPDRKKTVAARRAANARWERGNAAG